MRAAAAVARLVVVLGLQPLVEALPVAAFGRAATPLGRLALDDAELVDAAVAVDRAAHARGTIPDPLLVGVRPARRRRGLGLEQETECGP